jgi:hypothetical protein
MKQITAQEFLDMIKKNPSVFENWDTPLEITGFVICNDSPITHLSKYLIFSGKESNGNTASFNNCDNLKIATGTFENRISFSNSRIEKIEDLKIIEMDEEGWAADFSGCNHLKIAEGKYPGFVNFHGSGIHSIQNLHIENPSNKKNYANFIACRNLQTLQGWDLSKQIVIEAQKLAAEKERRAILNFQKKHQPAILPFL